MQHVKYSCAKCNHSEFENDTIAATGGGFSRFFDIQNRRFITISCKNCGYTELYRKKNAGTIENIFDFFTG